MVCSTRRAYLLCRVESAEIDVGIFCLVRTSRPTSPEGDASYLASRDLPRLPLRPCPLAIGPRVPPRAQAHPAVGQLNEQTRTRKRVESGHLGLRRLPQSTPKGLAEGSGAARVRNHAQAHAGVAAAALPAARLQRQALGRRLPLCLGSRELHVLSVHGERIVGTCPLSGAPPRGPRTPRAAVLASSSRTSSSLRASR